MIKASIVTAILSVLLFAACGGSGVSSPFGGSSAYSDKKRNFEVKFPPDAGKMATEPSAERGEDDINYTASNANGTFAVRVMKPDGEAAGESRKEQFAALGVKFPNDDKVRETGVQSRPAIESTGWIPSGTAGENGEPAKQYQRILAFRGENGLLYVLSFTTDEELKLFTPEVNDFFYSINVPRSTPVANQ